MRFNAIKINPYVVILIITIISLVFGEYSIFNIDQAPYLGFDAVKDGFVWYNTTLFDELLKIGEYIGINIFISITIIGILIRFMIFFYIYKISSHLTKDEITGYLTSFFFIWGSTIYGSVTKIIGAELAPRTIAFGLCLAGLYLYLKEKKGYTTNLFILAGAFHLGTAVSSYLITAVMEMMSEKKNYVYLIINLLGLGFLGLIFSNLAGLNTSLVDREWFDLILKYNPTMILGEWSIVAIIKLIISFVLIYYWTNKIDDITGIKLLNSCMIVYLFGFVFTTYIPINNIINLQLGRGMYVLLVLFITYLVYNFRYKNIGYFWTLGIFLLPNYKMTPAWIWIIASLIAAGLILRGKEKEENKNIKYIAIILVILILSFTVAIKENKKYASINRYYPETILNESYILGFNYMYKTVGDSIILTEPYSTTSYELAYLHGVKSYITNREKAVVTLSKEWAIELDRRSNNINNINKGGLEKIKKDGVEYIIAGHDLRINGTVPVLNVSDITIWKIK